MPCLDVAGGRVVKGVNFVGLRDVGDPVELGGAYSDAGADELVFLDISATLEERATLVDLVAASPSGSRSRSPSAAASGEVADAEALLRRRRQDLRQLRGARAAGARDRARERLGSQAVVVAIDATEGDVRSRAGTARRRDALPSGRVSASASAPARSCSRRSTPTARARATTSR